MIMQAHRQWCIAKKKK
jgi:hypothetical protein